MAEMPYVAVTRSDGTATVHLPGCSSALRAKWPEPYKVADRQDGDRACGRCLSDGLESAEAGRLLKPWGERYYTLATEVETHCRGLSDEDLEALGLAVLVPNDSNCWWAIHRMTPIVSEAVRMEQYRRQNRVEATEESG